MTRIASCEQELCPYWAGEGCVCSVMDISDQQRETAQREIRMFLGQEEPDAE